MTDRTSVLVLGAGSIGARHARNLLAAGAAVTVTDPDPGRAAAVDGAVAVPFDLDALGSFDGVVVASPTSEHAGHAVWALDHARLVLVEKPVATTVAEAEALLDPSAVDRVAVAFNLRFHEPVRRFVDLVHGGRVGPARLVRAWFGSWLPGWRPAVDYRTTYSARRELGGGVLLDAIHELDLLVWLLGPALAVEGAIVARAGDLDIDVEDTVGALLRGPGGEVVSLSLDYLSRAYRRGVEVVGADATARLDWARGVLEVEDGDGTETAPAADDVARSYEAQDTAFMAWLEGGPPLPVDAATAIASLRLAEAIRSAS